MFALLIPWAFNLFSTILVSSVLPQGWEEQDVTAKPSPSLIVQCKLAIGQSTTGQLSVLGIQQWTMDLLKNEIWIGVLFNSTYTQLHDNKFFLVCLCQQNVTTDMS